MPRTRSGAAFRGRSNIGTAWKGRWGAGAPGGDPQGYPGSSSGETRGKTHHVPDQSNALGTPQAEVSHRRRAGEWTGHSGARRAVFPSYPQRLTRFRKHHSEAVALPRGGWGTNTLTAIPQPAKPAPRDPTHLPNFFPSPLNTSPPKNPPAKSPHPKIPPQDSTPRFNPKIQPPRPGLSIRALNSDSQFGLSIRTLNSDSQFGSPAPSASADVPKAWRLILLKAQIVILQEQEPPDAQNGAGRDARPPPTPHPHQRERGASRHRRPPPSPVQVPIT
ncbi:MAG: hypothetical protein ACI8PQ_001573 [Planctomycetota bacterium]|jgi:hypothetical protein